MKPHLFVIATSCPGCAAEQSSARGDSARQYVDARVHPVVATTCASCHMETVTPAALGFIAADPVQTHDAGVRVHTHHALDGRSDIVGHRSVDGPIVTPPPAHMFDCSERELSAILEWLRLERDAA